MGLLFFISLSMKFSPISPQISVIMIRFSVEWIIVASLFYPVWKSYQAVQRRSTATQPHSPRKPNSSTMLTNVSVNALQGTETNYDDIELLSILVDEEHSRLREDFSQHLVREFSAENLVFWDQAKEFFEHCQSKAFTDLEMVFKATTMYFQFIAKGSSDEVLTLCWFSGNYIFMLVRALDEFPVKNFLE